MPPADPETTVDAPAVVDILSAAPGHLLRRSLAVFNAVWAETVGEPTSAQFGVLAALALQPRIDQRALGELASLDRSSTTDVVRRLARQSWLVKSRDPEDARRSVLELSLPAQHALAGLLPRVDAAHEQLLSPLTAPERTDLLASLRTLADVPAEVAAFPDLVTPGFLLRRAQQRHTALFAEHVGEGLTGSQFAVLTALHHCPGISHRTLRGMIAIDRTTVTGIVERLTAKGWVARERDPDDARKFRLALTPLAEGTYAATAERVAVVQKQLVAPLGSSARERVQSLLRRVAFARPFPTD